MSSDNTSTASQVSKTGQAIEELKKAVATVVAIPANMAIIMCSLIVLALIAYCAYTGEFFIGRIFFQMPFPLKMISILSLFVAYLSLLGAFYIIKVMIRSKRRGHLQRAISKIPSLGPTLTERVLAAKIFDCAQKNDYSSLSNFPVQGADSITSYIVEHYLEYRFGQQLYDQLHALFDRDRKAKLNLANAIDAIAIWTNDEMKRKEVAREILNHVERMAKMEKSASKALRFVEGSPTYFDSAIDNFAITVRQVLAATDLHIQKRDSFA